MMTKQEIRELYKKEVNTPYTTEELEFHMCDRRLKSLLEIMHSHNYELIYLAFDTRRYLFEGGPKPEGRLALLLRPGNNNDNAACARIHDIARFFGQYEHGATPRFPIVIYASRSTLSLVNVLEDFFFHESISDLNHHAKEFFCLIAHEGERRMSREEFARTLKEEGDAFIDAMTEYSKALCKFTHEREAEMREGEKTVKVEIVRKSKPTKVPTRPGKRTPFMEKQLADFRAFLEKNPVTLSYTIIKRARSFWHLHKAEYDQAAEANIGYSCYKALALAV